MKIVFLYDAIARVGGVEKIFVNRMNYLADILNYEVILITSSQGDHPYSFPLSEKVKHIELNVRFHTRYKYKQPLRWLVGKKMDYQFRKRFRKIISQLDPDIITAATYYKADEVCKLKCRAKKIIESHCVKSFTGKNDGRNRCLISNWLYKKELKAYEATIEKKSDIIVTLTQGDAQEWNAQNVKVIPNAIEKPSHPISPCNYSAKKIISAGRLEYEKGFDMLIESWKIVNEHHPDWELHVYGTGGRQKELKQQIKLLRLEKSIIIHAPVKDIYSVLSTASIYVLSSRYEGFGLILAEAMQAGLPCVSFNCPYGPADIINHKQNGLLVKKDDTTELAAALNTLIENKQLKEEYGKNALASVKRYAPEKIMMQWVELYDSILL